MRELLRRLDRRWIFLAMFLAVAIPILIQRTFPVKITLLTQAVFNRLEELKPGSRVLLVLDYDPSSQGELAPMATILTRHACLRRHKIYLMTLWPTGVPLLEQEIHNTIEPEFASQGLRYGTDYVNLGYKPGNEVVINVIATNLRKLFTTDNGATNLDNWPMTRDVRNLQDIDVIIDLSAGTPGVKEWVQYAGTPYDIPVAAGTTAVSSSQMFPYIPDQLFGLLVGIKGAAEYESAVAAKYPQAAGSQANAAAPGARRKSNEGLRRMAPQLWGHLLIVGLILLGNVIYFLDRRAGYKP